MTSCRFLVGNPVAAYPIKETSQGCIHLQHKDSKVEEAHPDLSNNNKITTSLFRKCTSKETSIRRGQYKEGYATNTQHIDIILQHASSSKHLTHRYVILLMLSR